MTALDALGRATMFRRGPASTPRRTRLAQRRAARGPRPPLPASSAFVLWVVAALSGLALWGFVYPVAVGTLQEEHSQQLLFARLRSQLSQATAPVGPTGYGKPVALLSIPGAGLRDVVVVEGTGSKELQNGPGHRRDTVLPGQAGTAVVLGKAVTFGGPLKHVHDLQTGAAISVTTGQGTFTYAVEEIRRPGDPFPAPLPEGKGRLVIGTAEGPGWRNSVAPTSVVYVDALLQGPAQPSPGGRPAAVPTEEQAMQPMTQSLQSLVLWLQVLVLAVVGAMWLRTRWGRWQAWAVSVPVLLALAVGASGTATQLLPNLL